MSSRIIHLLTLIVALPFLSHSQILPTFGNSRTGGSGMQFLKIGPDARSMAMSGAVTGTTDDVSALYWNPSGITKVDTGRINILISQSKYFADISANFAGVVVRTGPLSYVGLSLVSMNYGKMEETTEFMPEGTGRFVLLNNTLVGLTFAKILTDNFSFGLSAKWANESIAEVQTNNILFDLGLSYNIGIKHSRFGVAFSNFGLNVKPGGEVTILKLNGDQKVNNFSEVSAPGVFRIGAAFDPIHSRIHVLTLAGQLNHPTDNNETFALGTEYAFKGILYGRSGLEFGSDEASKFPTMGFGIKLPQRFGILGFDYGFTDKIRLGNTHRISLYLTLK